MASKTDAEFESGERGIIDVPYMIRMTAAMHRENVAISGRDGECLRVLKRGRTYVTERLVFNSFVRQVGSEHGVIDIPFHIRLMSAIHGENIVIGRRDGELLHVLRDDPGYMVTHWVHDMFIKRAK